METVGEDSTPETEKKAEEGKKGKSMNWIEQLGEVIKQLNTIPKAGSTAKEPPETKKGK